MATRDAYATILCVQKSTVELLQPRRSFPIHNSLVLPHTGNQSFPHIHDSLFPQISPIVADFRTQTSGCCYDPLGKMAALTTSFVLQDFLV